MPNLRRIMGPENLGHGDQGVTPQGIVWFRDYEGRVSRMNSEPGQHVRVIGGSNGGRVVVPSANVPTDTLAGKDTDNITEGSTNLYFTDTRVYTKAKAILAQGTGITVTADDNAQTLTIATTITDTDKLAAVSANDTTPGYLNGKLTAGSNITLTEGSDGGNETLTIAASASGGTQVYFGTSAVGTDSYAITPSPALGSYADSVLVLLRADVGNTGAASINVSSLGAKAIKRKGGSEDLDGNDIVANELVMLVYDSALDVFQLLGLWRDR